MYDNHKSIIFLNGEFISASDRRVSYYSQALHYGYAAFEGMRSYEIEPDKAGIFKPRRHFERLLHSTRLMHMKVPYTAQQLIDFAYELLERNKLTTAYIRPLVFGGEQMALRPSTEPNLLMCTWRWPKYFESKSLRLMTSSYRRPHPDAFNLSAKISGHYVNGIIAAHEARQKGYDDALQLDPDGFVAQATGANFFYERDNVLYTPKQKHILPGITRKVIMELADEMHIKVVEKNIKPEDLNDIDGAFLTGTAVEVAPIQSIDDKKFRFEAKDSIGATLAVKYHNVATKKDDRSLTYF